MSGFSFCRHRELVIQKAIFEEWICSLILGMSWNVRFANAESVYLKQAQDPNIQDVFESPSLLIPPQDRRHSDENVDEVKFEADTFIDDILPD